MSPPYQPGISLESIQAMTMKKPRRKQLGRQGKALLQRLQAADKGWSIQFPFTETLWNSFEMMCEVPSTGLQEDPFKRWYTHLKTLDTSALTRVRLWQETVGRYVVIRDCLALSFALDFEHEDGDPKKPQTSVGALRYRAKTYDRPPPSRVSRRRTNSFRNACRS
jgi:hypothetical protein